MTNGQVRGGAAWLAPLLLAVVLGCGSGSGNGDASSVACGSSNQCAGNQYCIHPCCGGAPAQCSPLPASGQCDPGTHSGCLPPGQCSAAQCCQEDPCTPADPYCAAQPQGNCTGHDCAMICG